MNSIRHQTTCLALALLVLLSGCASIDFDYPRVESTAITDTEDTHLGVRVRELSASRPDDDQSGFFVLRDGIEALTARLLLAKQAERSIDTQYFLIKTDDSSKAFIAALLGAADRGVRVRFLLDDAFTEGYDAGLAALESHPNIEIRIVNPFERGVGGRSWRAFTNLSRISRRMHAKTFTVDGQITILGGRNIADEYFGAREDAKFGDLDVAGIGPISAEVSAMFDSYWNHPTALPVPAFARMPDDPEAELLDLRDRLATWHKGVVDSEYAEAVQATVLAFMDSDKATFEWAPYQLVYDSPDKGVSRVTGPGDIKVPLAQALQSAERELVVLTPYFVPQKTGIEFFSELESRGVEVTIVTNSLAANNHAIVHSGYAPARKPLLRAGVRLFEVRPDADFLGYEVVAASDAKATLHTKAFVVDREKSFIGSFNFDPRSAVYNTESGVIIESESIGEQFGRTIDAKLKEETYELFLNEDGKLRWRGYRNGETTIYKKDPESSLGQRSAVGFARLLPIKGQL